jgi:hypothetical protein
MIKLIEENRKQLFFIRRFLPPDLFSKTLKMNGRKTTVFQFTLCNWEMSFTRTLTMEGKLKCTNTWNTMDLLRKIFEPIKYLGRSKFERNPLQYLLWRNATLSGESVQTYNTSYSRLKISRASKQRPFGPEDRSNIFLRNIGEHFKNRTVLCTRRAHFS